MARSHFRKNLYLNVARSHFSPRPWHPNPSPWLLRHGHGHQLPPRAHVALPRHRIRPVGSPLPLPAVLSPRWAASPTWPLSPASEALTYHTVSPPFFSNAYPSRQGLSASWMRTPWARPPLQILPHRAAASSSGSSARPTRTSLSATGMCSRAPNSQSLTTSALQNALLTRPSGPSSPTPGTWASRPSSSGPASSLPPRAPPTRWCSRTLQSSRSTSMLSLSSRRHAGSARWALEIPRSS